MPGANQLHQQPTTTYRIAADLATLDINAKRQEYLFGVPSALQGLAGSLLADPRDLPALNLLLNVCCLVVPAAVLLHVLPAPSHVMGACYFLLSYATFLQRFMLTLHYTQHRPLFKKGGVVSNLVLPYLLAPLFGLPCGAYHLHHVVMHHVEGNAAHWDASSTEPYQRDKLPHFLHYWLRFLLWGAPDLVCYAAKRRRWGLATGCGASMAVYWGLLGAVLLLRPVAGLWVWLVPHVVSSAALMFGNWSQHIFIDPAAPADPYRLTYNCVACADNRRTYNDGYHAIHHANSRLHWSEMPQRWLDTLDTHEAQDALVFKGIGFFDVGLAVMTGRLEWLAQRVVPCGPRQAARTQQQWVDLMKQRLAPIQRAAVHK